MFDIKKIRDAMDLKKDSKLAVYVNEDLDFFFEIKNLNRISALYFLLVMLDKLLSENIIDKKILLAMINEIL